MVRQITKRAMAATSARDTFVKGTLNFESFLKYKKPFLKSPIRRDSA